MPAAPPAAAPAPAVQVPGSGLASQQDASASPSAYISPFAGAQLAAGYGAFEQPSSWQGCNQFASQPQQLPQLPPIRVTSVPMAAGQLQLQAAFDSSSGGDTGGSRRGHSSSSGGATSSDEQAALAGQAAAGCMQAPPTYLLSTIAGMTLCNNDSSSNSPCSVLSQATGLGGLAASPDASAAARAASGSAAAAAFLAPGDAMTPVLLRGNTVTSGLPSSIHTLVLAAARGSANLGGALVPAAAAAAVAGDDAMVCE